MKNKITIEQQAAISLVLRKQLKFFKLWIIFLLFYSVITLIYYALDFNHSNEFIDLIWGLLFALNFILFPILLGLFQLFYCAKLGFAIKVTYFIKHFLFAIVYLGFLLAEFFEILPFTWQSALGETFAATFAIGIPSMLVISFCTVLLINSKIRRS